MTQTVCQILIRIGTLRHLWKSIKSLRKLSRDDNTISQPNIHPDILEIWTILGLHSLYVATGIEGICQYVPLYFYFKMVGLSLFFFLPSASNRNIPAQYIFHKVLVKGVDQLHNFLDRNVLGFLKQQIWILPWRMADLVFPGLLRYSSYIGWDECDQRRMEVWIRREQKLMQSREKMPYRTSSVRIEEKISKEMIEVEDKHNNDAAGSKGENQNLKTNTDSPVNETESMHSQSGPTKDLSHKATNRSPFSDKESNKEQLLTKNCSHRTSSSKDSTQSKKANHFSQTNTPSKSSPKSTKYSASSSTRTTTASSHSPSIQSFSTPPREPMKRSKSSFTSPMAQSRLSSSSVQIQNFSRSHVSKNTRRQTIMPVIRDTKKSKALAASNLSPTSITSSTSKRRSKSKSSSNTLSSASKKKDLRRYSSSSVSLNRKSSSASITTISSKNSTFSSFGDSDQDLFLSSPPKPSKARRSKILQAFLSPKQLGKSVRSVVTGSANIRVRDFLFDLDLPSSSTHIYTSSNDSYVHSTKNSLDQYDENYEEYDDGEGPLLSLSKKKTASKESNRRRRSAGDILHRRKPKMNSNHSSRSQKSKSSPLNDSRFNITKANKHLNRNNLTKSSSKSNSKKETEPKSTLRRSKRIAANNNGGSI